MLALFILCWNRWGGTPPPHELAGTEKKEMLPQFFLQNIKFSIQLPFPSLNTITNPIFWKKKHIILYPINIYLKSHYSDY